LRVPPFTRRIPEVSESKRERETEMSGADYVEALRVYNEASEANLDGLLSDADYREALRVYRIAEAAYYGESV
jgi:hypothetical protein